MRREKVGLLKEKNRCGWKSPEPFPDRCSPHRTPLRRLQSLHSLLPCMFYGHERTGFPLFECLRFKCIDYRGEQSFRIKEKYDKMFFMGIIIPPNAYTPFGRNKSRQETQPRGPTPPISDYICIVQVYPSCKALISSSLEFA